MNKDAAINKPQTMAGRVVVVNVGAGKGKGFIYLSTLKESR
jgi:hypothetical protein